MTDTRAEKAEAALEKVYKDLEKSGAYVAGGLYAGYKRDLYSFKDITVTNLAQCNKFDFKVKAVWVTLESPKSAKGILDKILAIIDNYKAAGITNISMAIEGSFFPAGNFRYDVVKDLYQADYAFCGKKDKKYYILSKEGFIQLAGEDGYIDHTQKD